MPWNDNLTGPALQVAASNATRLRVRAGPGTGKTFAMMRRVARILENGVPPSEVLVSTFTRVAAADLKNALTALRVSGAQSVKATTIHGLCFGILQRNEVLQRTGRVARPLLDFESRFLLEDLNAVNFGDVHQRRRRLKAFESAWARLQNEQPGWPVDAVDQAFQDVLLDWLRFHRAMLIGELVPVALRYLRDNPAARELHQFKTILVDEYQDLNTAEQRIVDLLASNAELTVVGDEDQSIYSFKHAHPAGIEDFHQRNSGTADETLSVCRRCPAWIVELANNLIDRNSRNTSRTLQPDPSNGRGEIKIVQWRSAQAEAEGLARFIQDRVNAGIQPRGILVLSPSRKFGYAIRDSLNSIGVQAHSFFREQALDGDPKRLSECRAQQAMTLLTLAASPTDVVALRSWCGFGSTNLRKSIWERVREKCAETGRSVPEILGDIKDGQIHLPYASQLRNRLVDLEERLQECAGLTGQDLIDKLFPDEGSLQTIREFAVDAPDDCDARTLLETLRVSITQPELPTDVDYVRVMSLHKSKGLTAELVIVLGCVEGLVPQIDNELNEHDQEAMLEEQRRLFYVALTRTRETLILSSVTSLPTAEAHRLRIGSSGRHGYVRVQTSRFIDELGPSRPEPILGDVLC